MLRSKLIEDSPERCITSNISTKEMKFMPGQKVEMTSCLTSLLNGDGREIFTMGNSGAINSKVMPEQCLSVYNVKEGEPLMLSACDDN